MWRKLLLVAVCLGAAGVSLRGHIVVSAEFRGLVADADWIVRGLVAEVRPVDVPGRGIESVLTLRVESVVKGADAQFVYVRVPGGEIGRTRFVMVGAPRFRAGERAVFFLERDADSAWRPVGLSQGVYRVRVDGASGVSTIPAPVMSRVGAAAGRGQPSAPPQGSMPVEEFERLITSVETERVAVRRDGGGR